MDPPPRPAATTAPDPDATAAPVAERFDVALEPGQAWSRGETAGEAAEVVIPGLLLDDLGGCSNVEAAMPMATFFQMLAMVSIQEARMLAARTGSPPSRIRAEANVWMVEGRLQDRRLAVAAVAALDRVVVDAYGTHCVETMSTSQLLPGPKEWR